MSSKVERILRTLPALPEHKEPRALRVAVYCRVSTDHEEQQLSFTGQQRAYTDLIRANSSWTLADVYADEGTTGTSTEKRPEFLRMIADCEAGKIDLIITKSISRFARNTLECLTYVRHLQSIGVDLIFESNNIDTRTAFSEMLLTVLAAFAQEESRSISENTKWGIRKRYENGISRWCSLYGYAKGYVVIPEQAQVVREIFTLYEQGSTIGEILRILQQRGIPTKTGRGSWTLSAVHTMLKNEKYAGDILLQKFLTTDHISHKAVKNDCTEVPAYYMKEHHAPIVPRKTFDRVQQILRLRSQGSCAGRKNSRCVQYPFGGRLFCPFCGSALYQRFLPMQPIRGRYWCCEVQSCTGFLFPSDRMENAVCAAYNSLVVDNYDPQMQTVVLFKQEHPTFAKAEYYWIDELISRIEIGAHRQDPDCHITVYWRHGGVSAIPTGVQPGEPQQLGVGYRGYLAQHEAQRAKAAAQVESQRESDIRAARMDAIMLGRGGISDADHQNSADAGPAQAAGGGVLSGIDPA